ncbi:MAG: redox-regulated ATPase YchF [Thermoplasmata archaeon]|nr:redox-regulated ATPase YchF [Thermoplasmata archaeon]
MEVGVVGKPNVGKSTLFNALTLSDVPMAPYPFTTIKPNRGVGAVRVPCPHLERKTPCTPGNSRCVDGTRFVPVNLIDVPGLVPGAHEGKGLGHQFLDELRQADGFLQVVDASGGTNAEGVVAAAGTTDPKEEVEWLEEELVAWVADILSRDFARHTKSVELVGGSAEEFLRSRLTGLAIPPSQLTAAVRTTGLDPAHPSHWSSQDRVNLSRSLLRAAKPRLVAANKCDRSTPEAVARLAEAIEPIPVVPTCAEAELTLRRASRAGLVSYRPGDGSFTERDPEKLSLGQRRALEEIRGILARYGSTGVQQALEATVFSRLGQMVVFPVEDETTWTDSKGRVLPDAFIVPTGTSAKAVAYRVHSDLGEGFIRAVDGRTHRALGAEHPLENGAIVRIVSKH